MELVLKCRMKFYFVSSLNTSVESIRWEVPQINDFFKFAILLIKARRPGTALIKISIDNNPKKSDFLVVMCFFFQLSVPCMEFVLKRSLYC
jgi:hypothetical protein